MLLEVVNLTVRYDKAMLINDLTMAVDTGELVSLVGPNGAGKSTLLRAVTGLVARDREITRRSAGGEITLEGTVVFDGEPIHRMQAHQIVKRGLVHCPERRRPFREMSVLDNLLAGAYVIQNKSEIQERLDKVYELFPVLRGRTKQISGTLSGGEQQMLAIGRAMMAEPKLLCIDEPSTGLAPKLRREVFQKIAEINGLGITVLLVEQEVSTVFKLASRNYVLSSGKIIAQGSGDELLQDEVLRKTYLGL
jgi:branched-chain amino acid transport system ATP-binding protein